MRRLAAWTCCLLLAIPQGLWAAPPGKGGRPESPSRIGWLQITCPVEGARFVIDEENEADSIAGTTPLSTPIPLPPGTHTVRVVKDGYLPFSEVFDVKPGQTVEVEVDLIFYSGTLRALTAPSGAEVQVDGASVGRTPLEQMVAIGEHVVRFTLPGHVEEVRRVQVRTGQTTEVTVRLVSEAEARKASEGPVFWKQWWFWTVIGVVAGGAVAAGVAIPMTRSSSRAATPDGEIALP